MSRSCWWYVWQQQRFIHKKKEGKNISSQVIHVVLPMPYLPAVSFVYLQTLHVTTSRSPGNGNMEPQFGQKSGSHWNASNTFDMVPQTASCWISHKYPRSQALGRFVWSWMVQAVLSTQTMESCAVLLISEAYLSCHYGLCVAKWWFCPCAWWILWPTVICRFWCRFSRPR